MIVESSVKIIILYITDKPRIKKEIEYYQVK